MSDWQIAGHIIISCHRPLLHWLLSHAALLHNYVRPAVPMLWLQVFNTFCDVAQFLLQSPQLPFYDYFGRACRLAAPKRSCKSNFLKFLLRHAHAERQRARGEQGERRRESTHAAHSGNALPRHSTAFENQYDCDYAALAVSVSVSNLCECVPVSVCVPVCICADDVARPARILKLTNCAL